MLKIKKIVFSLMMICLMTPGFVWATGQTTFNATVIDASEEYVKVEDSAGLRFSIENQGLNDYRLKMHKGDRVVVNKLIMDDGSENYIIVDFVRRFWVYVLIALFIFTVLFICGWYGFRSLINLGVTLLVVFFIIIPLILRGWNPVLVSVGGGILAMIFSIYFLFGINKKAHSVLLGIVATLVIAGLLSSVFVRLLSLTGFVNDEAVFLVTLGYGHIDMRGLLLAAILIGVLGVVDDLVVNQVSVVQELKQSNSEMSTLELYSSAMRVGRDHTSSMVNTLVLAYAGASFPLMILFVLGQPPLDSFSSIINNEIVATEIARTLVGSISLLLAVPISTFIAVKFYKK